MMPDFEELLEDAEDSLVFDADDEPVFDPELDENSGVVIVEPKIINVGRDRKKRDLRKLQQKSGDS